MADAGSIVESLPNRPLSLEEAEHLTETGPIHPGSVMQSAGGPLVFTLLVTGEETLYGLGYDDGEAAWEVAVTMDADEGHEALGRALKEWGQEHYEAANHVEQDVELQRADSSPDLPGEPAGSEPEEGDAEGDADE